MRSSEVDSVKGLAIIGVVIAHISFQERFGENVVLFINFLQLVFGWCVVAFFFCSGYLSKKNENSIRGIQLYILSRTRRLLIPCLIYSLSYKIALMLLSLTGLFAWDSLIPGSMYELFLFVFIPVGPQFYFLLYLFCFSVMISLLSTRLGDNLLQVFGVLLFVISYMVVEMPPYGYGPDFNLLPMYLAAYLMGILGSRSNFRGIFYHYVMWVFAVVMVGFMKNTLIVIYLLIPPVLLLAMQRIESLNSLVQSTRLGEYSPGIYVWHAPLVMPFASMIFDKILNNGYVELLGTFLLTILVCYLIQNITYRHAFLKPWRF